MSEAQQTRKKQRSWQSLSILLVISLGVVLYHWILVKQDTNALSKETSTFGIIVAESRRKGSHYVSYSFTYEDTPFIGRQEFDGMIGNTVKVFFASDDPSLNSLTEYSQKIVKDRRMMIVSGLVSIGLAAILVYLLASKLRA